MGTSAADLLKAARQAKNVDSVREPSVAREEVELPEPVVEPQPAEPVESPTPTKPAPVEAVVPTVPAQPAAVTPEPVAPKPAAKPKPVTVEPKPAKPRGGSVSRVLDSVAASREQVAKVPLKQTERRPEESAPTADYLFTQEDATDLMRKLAQERLSGRQEYGEVLVDMARERDISPQALILASERENFRIPQAIRHVTETAKLRPPERVFSEDIRPGVVAARPTTLTPERYVEQYREKMAKDGQWPRFTKTTAAEAYERRDASRAKIQQQADKPGLGTYDADFKLDSTKSGFMPKNSAEKERRVAKYGDPQYDYALYVLQGADDGRVEILQEFNYVGKDQNKLFNRLHQNVMNTEKVPVQFGGKTYFVRGEGPDTILKQNPRLAEAFEEANVSAPARDEALQQIYRRVYENAARRAFSEIAAARTAGLINQRVFLGAPPEEYLGDFEDEDGNVILSEATPSETKLSLISKKVKEGNYLDALGDAIAPTMEVVGFSGDPGEGAQIVMRSQGEVSALIDSFDILQAATLETLAAKADLGALGVKAGQGEITPTEAVKEAVRRATEGVATGTLTRQAQRENFMVNLIESEDARNFVRSYLPIIVAGESLGLLDENQAQKAAGLATAALGFGLAVGAPDPVDSVRLLKYTPNALRTGRAAVRGGMRFRGRGLPGTSVRLFDDTVEKIADELSAAAEAGNPKMAEGVGRAEARVRTSDVSRVQKGTKVVEGEDGKKVVEKTDTDMPWPKEAAAPFIGAVDMVDAAIVQKMADEADELPVSMDPSWVNDLPVLSDMSFAAATGKRADLFDSDAFSALSDAEKILARDPKASREAMLHPALARRLDAQRRGVERGEFRYVYNFAFKSQQLDEMQEMLDGKHVYRENAAKRAAEATLSDEVRAVLGEAGVSDTVVTKLADRMYEAVMRNVMNTDDLDKVKTLANSLAERLEKSGYSEAAEAISDNLDEIVATVRAGNEADVAKGKQAVQKARQSLVESMQTRAQAYRETHEALKKGEDFGEVLARYGRKFRRPAEYFAEGTLSPAGRRFYDKAMEVYGDHPNLDEDKLLTETLIVDSIFRARMAEGTMTPEQAARAMDNIDLRVEFREPEAPPDGPKNLLVAHALTPENLEFVLENEGKIPGPSLGVVRVEDPGTVSAFGQVYLLGKPDILFSAEARTFAGDAYTPRAPRSRTYPPAHTETAFSDVGGVGTSEVLGGAARYLSGSRETQGLPELSVSRAVVYLLTQRALQRGADVEDLYALLSGLSPHNAQIFESFSAWVDTGRVNKNEDVAALAAYLMDRDALDNAAAQLIARHNEDLLPAYAKSEPGFEDFLAEMRGGDIPDGVDEVLRAWGKDYFKTLAKTAEDPIVVQSLNMVAEGRVPRYLLDGELYTPEAASRMMRENAGGDVRLSEGYGVSPVDPMTYAAAFKPELSDLDAVKANRDAISLDDDAWRNIRRLETRLVDRAQSRLSGALGGLDEAQVSEEIYTVMANAAREAASEGREAVEDDFYRALSAAISVGELGEGGADVLRVVADDLLAFHEAILDLPVKYFESKIMRPVDLNEFTTVVYPGRMDPATKAALEAKGLTVREVSGTGSSADEVFVEAVRETARQEDLLFQAPTRTPGRASPEQPLRQDGASAKGQVELGKGNYRAGEGKPIVTIFENGDFTTLVHETAHIARRTLPDEDQGIIATWVRASGVDVEIDPATGRFVGEEDAVREAEELFARGFEQYLAEGKAPNTRLAEVFEKIKQFMLEVYESARSLGVEINDDMRRVYDRMLIGTEEAPTMKRVAGRGDRPTFVAKEWLARRLETITGEEHDGDKILARLEAGETLDLPFRVRGKSQFDMEDYLDLQITLDRMRPAEDAPTTPRSSVPFRSERDFVEEQTFSEEIMSYFYDDVRDKLSPFAVDPNFEKGFNKETVAESLITLGDMVVRGVGAVPGLYKGTKVLATLILGGDSDAMWRTMSPALRERVRAQSRVIIQRIGDTNNLLREADSREAWDNVIDYLGGTPVRYYESGRAVVTSGHDAASEAGKIIENTYDNIKGIKVQVPEAYRLEHGLSDNDVFLRRGGGFTSNFNEAATFEDVVNEVGASILARKTVAMAGDEGAARGTAARTEIPNYSIAVGILIDKLSGEVGGSPFVTNMFATVFDGLSPQAVSSEGKLSEFLAAMLTLAGAVPQYGPEGAASVRFVERSGVERMRDFFSVADGILSTEAKTRVATLISANGYQITAFRRLMDAGLTLSGRERQLLTSMTSGYALTADEYREALELFKTFGVSAKNLKPAEQVLARAAGVADQALPPNAERMIQSALTLAVDNEIRALVDGKSQSRIMRFLTGFNQLIKNSWVRGVIIPRARMAILDLFEAGVNLTVYDKAPASMHYFFKTLPQLPLMTPGVGFGVTTLGRTARGAESLARRAEELGPVGIGLAKLLDLVGKSSLADLRVEDLREALSKGGEDLEKALFGLSFDARINDIFRGEAGVIEMADGRKYRIKDVRDALIEGGIVASFASSELGPVARARAVPESEKLPNLGVGRHMDDTAELAEAWSERSRVGAALAVMEVGADPVTAARTVIKAMYDYPGSVADAERISTTSGFVINLLNPFWTYQKNINRRMVDAILDPEAAIRFKYAMKAYDKGDEAISAMIYEVMFDPYGFDTSNMREDQKQFYYTFRTAWEEKLGLTPYEQTPLQRALFTHAFLRDAPGAANIPRVNGRPLGISKSVNDLASEYVRGFAAEYAEEPGVPVDSPEYQERLREVQRLAEGVGAYYVARPDPARYGRDYEENRFNFVIPMPRTESVRSYIAATGREDAAFWMTVPGLGITDALEYNYKMATALPKAVNYMLAPGPAETADFAEFYNLDLPVDPLRTPLLSEVAFALQGGRRQRVSDTTARVLSSLGPFSPGLVYKGGETGESLAEDQKALGFGERAGQRSSRTYYLASPVLSALYRKTPAREILALNDLLARGDDFYFHDGMPVMLSFPLEFTGVGKMEIRSSVEAAESAEYDIGDAEFDLEKSRQNMGYQRPRDE